MEYNLGVIAPVPAGDWNVETNYQMLYIVAYNGQSYISKVNNNTGHLPTDTLYWQLMSAQGSTGGTGETGQGTQGIQGPMGIQGPAGSGGSGSGAQGSQGSTGNRGNGWWFFPGRVNPNVPIRIGDLIGNDDTVYLYDLIIDNGGVVFQVTRTDGRIVSGMNRKFEVIGRPGANGTQGATGKTGATGIQGADGIMGANGVQGFAGEQGNGWWYCKEDIDPYGRIEFEQLIGGREYPLAGDMVMDVAGKCFMLNKVEERTIEKFEYVTTITGGNRGEQGLQGIQGPQGIQGIRGLEGIQGRDGTYAAQGIQGTRGAQGIQGPQGQRGNVGAAGSSWWSVEEPLDEGQVPYPVDRLRGPDHKVYEGDLVIDIEGKVFLIKETDGTNVITWEHVLDIRGNDGAQGAQGRDGAYAAQGIQGMAGRQGLQGYVGPTGTPSTNVETWTFTMEDDTVVTKQIYIQ